MSSKNIRAGVRVRSNQKKISLEKKKKYFCTNCKLNKIKRISFGIWFCAKCKVSIADNAYEFKNELYLPTL